MLQQSPIFCRCLQGLRLLFCVYVGTEWSELALLPKPVVWGFVMHVNCVGFFYITFVSFNPFSYLLGLGGRANGILSSMFFLSCCKPFSEGFVTCVNCVNIFLLLSVYCLRKVMSRKFNKGLIFLFV